MPFKCDLDEVHRGRHSHARSEDFVNKGSMGWYVEWNMFRFQDDVVLSGLGAATSFLTLVLRMRWQQSVHAML